MVTNAQLPEHRSAKPSELQSDQHLQSKPKTMLGFSTLELREALVVTADEYFFSTEKFTNVAISEKLALAHTLEWLIELSTCKLTQRRVARTGQNREHCGRDGAHL